MSYCVLIQKLGRTICCPKFTITHHAPVTSEYTRWILRKQHPNWDHIRYASQCCSFSCVVFCILKLQFPLLMNVSSLRTCWLAAQRNPLIKPRNILCLSRPSALSHRLFSQNMPPKKEGDLEPSSKSDKTEPHQYQAGSSTHRKEDEWKHREPYRVHEDGEDFPVKWKGKCHCGKTKYQLSRDKPLASKYCHCTTCQRLHGVSLSSPQRNQYELLTHYRHHFNGLQSSTRVTLTSLTAITTWDGMTLRRKTPHTTFPAKFPARFVELLLWTKVGI